MNLNRIFYGTVLTIALVGAGQAAAGWLDWYPVFAFIAVGAVELGGVTLSVHADRRRQVGERAIAARVLSALVALGAVAVNLFGHITNLGQAAFFGGMSALGYLVWIVDSGARRRDALRAAGALDRAAPSFGAWTRLRHPALTRRAREIALDARESIPARVALATARDEARARLRHAAIEESLRLKIAKAVDPLTARIATSVYDMHEVAAQLAATADYTMLTDLIARDLTPARLAVNVDRVDQGDAQGDTRRGPYPPRYDRRPSTVSLERFAPVAAIEALTADPDDDAPVSPAVDLSHLDTRRAPAPEVDLTPAFASPDVRPISTPPASSTPPGTKKAAIEAAYAALVARGDKPTVDALRIWAAEHAGVTVSERTAERVRSLIPAWRERTAKTA